MIRYLAVGIDVSAEWFDVYIHTSRESKRFSYTGSGVETLLQWLSGMQADIHVGLEATGRLEIDLARSIQRAGHRVSVLDPLRVVRHRQSFSKSAKTDRQDARAIARYVAERKPEQWVEKPDAYRRLSELCLHREHLVEEVRRLENWMRRPATDEDCRKDIESLLRIFRSFLDQTEERLHAAVNVDPELSRQVSLLCTIKGVGFKTAVAVLSEMGPVGAYVDARSLALAAGLAPMMCSSGKNLGKGLLPVYGNERLRRSLYMAALVAKRHDPGFRSFAARIAGNSPKRAKTVVVATMRKLTHVIYGVLKSQMPYNLALMVPYAKARAT